MNFLKQSESFYSSACKPKLTVHGLISGWHQNLLTPADFSPFIFPPPPTNSLLSLKCTLRPQYIYISSFCLDPSLLYLVNSYSSFRTQFKYHLLFRPSLIPPGRVVSFLSGVLLFFTLNFFIKGIYHFESYLLHDMWGYDCLLHNKAA